MTKSRHSFGSCRQCTPSSTGSREQGADIPINRPTTTCGNTYSRAYGLQTRARVSRGRSVSSHSGAGRKSIRGWLRKDSGDGEWADC